LALSLSSARFSLMVLPCFFPTNLVSEAPARNHRLGGHSIRSKALNAQTVKATDDLRSLEKGRLDSLQLASWDKAMAGDIEAAGAVMRIVMARCRLLGLDRVELRPDEVRWPRTVVVPPTG
jgi:hypothetical protein